MPLIESTARILCLLLGLIAPGAMLLRALLLPFSVAAAFAGSTVVLFGAVIIFQLVGVPIAWMSLTLALVIVSLAAGLAARRAPPPFPAPDPRRPAGWLLPFAAMGRWTPLYLLFWGLVLFRALAQPLSGPDVEFRWSWLAEQMLRHASLDFYPPRGAADFETYFWVESLPPGVAGLYAWAYGCAGEIAPAWTAPVVLLQFWALHELLWRVAEMTSGTRAARFACLAAAATPLLNWSFFLGQETGLTSLALLGLVWALLQFRAGGKTIVLAGLFAALGTSLREYGMVFPLLGFAALWFGKTPWRVQVAFLLTSSSLLGLWLIRTTVLTGNPFYSLDFAGLFPRNELFHRWREHDRALNAGNIAGWDGVVATLRLLVLFAPAAVAGWLQVFSREVPHRLLLVTGIVAFAGLWLISIPHTSGGLFYSLRVAAPALAIGAVVAGHGLARVSARFSTTVIAVVLLGTLPQTLTLPRNAWRISVRDWLNQTPAPAAAAIPEEETRALASAIGRGQAVVTDNPGFQSRFAPAGITALPPWCPQAAWLFEPGTDSREVMRQWQETPLRYVLLARFPPTLEFIQKHARWSAAPLAYRIKWQNERWVLFELRLQADR